MLCPWVGIWIEWLYFHYCFESPKLTVKLVHHEFLRLHLTCLKNSRIAERRHILFCYLFISCTNPLCDLVFSPLIEYFVGSLKDHVRSHGLSFNSNPYLRYKISGNHVKIQRKRPRRNSKNSKDSKMLVHNWGKRLSSWI